MNLLAWILSDLLAIVFLGSGAMKIASRKGALRARGLTVLEDFSASSIKGIGLVEVLGAIGILLPWWFRSDGCGRRSPLSVLQL